uniref:Uncharacterized protein n=1 Tax=Rhizophora mucronata TaxID=61149 RepID=A0A2P2KR87_RHIMU
MSNRDRQNLLVSH